MAKIALARQGESRTPTIQKLYNCVPQPWLADLHRVRDRKLDQFRHPRLAQHVQLTQTRSYQLCRSSSLQGPLSHHGQAERSDPRRMGIMLGLWFDQRDMNACIQSSTHGTAK